MPWLLESNQWVCDVCWIEVPAAATDDPETIQHNCHKDRFKNRRVRRGSGQPLPDLPCLYRGELLREATFELCGSYRGQKVGIHRCLLHGDECTTRKYCDRTPGHRFCNLCQDRFTPEQNEGYEWHDEGRVTYQSAPRAPVKNRILLKFGHGLGDVVFFSSVLAHLREHRPDLEIDIDVGHERRGLVAHLVGPHQGPPYDAEYAVKIHECDRVYPDGRISKWGKCLWEEFGVLPCADLCRFSLPATTPHDAAAQQWADGRKLVLIHHAGMTSKSYKDLPWSVVERAARTIVEHGGVPVLLDRSGRTLQGGVTLSRCPFGSNDATWILALARQAVLCIGIDSGPGHIFAGSGTPTIQCWTRHHPVHYGNPSTTVTHLVPRDHENWIYGEPEICREWLSKHYSLSVYDDLGRGLTREVIGWLASI